MRPHTGRSFMRNHAPPTTFAIVTEKKKEDDPYGSRRSEEKGSFRSAEEDTFQSGVHTSLAFAARLRYDPRK
jgi:hypothetical protein